MILWDKSYKRKFHDFLWFYILKIKSSPVWPSNKYQWKSVNCQAVSVYMLRSVCYKGCSGKSPFVLNASFNFLSILSQSVHWLSLKILNCNGLYFQFQTNSLCQVIFGKWSLQITSCCANTMVFKLLKLCFRS